MFLAALPSSSQAWCSGPQSSSRPWWLSCRRMLGGWRAGCSPARTGRERRVPCPARPHEGRENGQTCRQQQIGKSLLLLLANQALPPPPSLPVVHPGPAHASGDPFLPHRKTQNSSHLTGGGHPEANKDTLTRKPNRWTQGWPAVLFGKDFTDPPRRADTA